MRTEASAQKVYVQPMNFHPAQIEVGARSETGYVRSENQDRMSGTHVPLGRLYIVADGMGGHKGGATAAELTVRGLQQHLTHVGTALSVVDAIRTAFSKTNETIYQQGHAGDPVTAGMGSTAVLLLITGPHAYIAHVGDSRAYLYRSGLLQSVTTDHTRVQKMVNAGMITEAEARAHADAGVLERAMGNKPSVDVDIREKLSLTNVDGILLCSDGLSGYVSDQEIQAVLQSSSTAQEIPDRLVELALQKGGVDNVTVQFIQYGQRRETRAGRRKRGVTLWPWKKSRQFVMFSLLVSMSFFAVLMLSSFARNRTTSLLPSTLWEMRRSPQKQRSADAPSRREKELREKLDRKEKELNKTQGNLEAAKRELGKVKAQKEGTAKNDDSKKRAPVPALHPEEYFTFSFP